MRGRLFRPAVLTAFALVVLISCSEDGEQTKPADIPLRTTGAPPVAALPADAEQGPPPITTATTNQDKDFFEKLGFFEKLRVGLEDLGIGSGHAECIINTLEDRGADETALEAAELDSVLVLEEASWNCLIDLVEHIERGSDISRSAARSGR